MQQGGALAIVAEAQAAETPVPSPPPSTPPPQVAAAAGSTTFSSGSEELWLRAPAGLAAAANAMAAARMQRNWAAAGSGPAGRISRNQSF